MRRLEPPSTATWLLERFTPGESNDALAGDLLEEYRSGRSSRWYWRQVLAAIAIGCCREIFRHRTVLVFAALWATLAPAWLLYVANLEERFNLNERIWQMDWPWSTVMYLGLILAADLIFIWTGLVLYIFVHSCFAGRFKIRHLSQGVLASAPVLVILCVTLVVLPARFLQKGHSVQWPPATPLSSYTITDAGPIIIQRVSPQEEWTVRYGDKVVDPYSDPRYAIADLRTSALVVRLPFFLCVLCALWGTASRFQNRRNGVAE